VKYASNAFHALKICFANEMALIGGALGADAREVMRIFALDRKLNISDAYLKPGFAFGGSCLPKDVRALVWAGRTADVETPVLSAILPSNAQQIRDAIDTVLSLGRRRIGVVGLAFKAGTDDLRESPIVTLVEALIGKGLDIRIYDRDVSIARLVGANRRYIESEIPHIASLLCDSLDALASHAEVLIVSTRSADAQALVDAVDPECTVVDLTRARAGGFVPVTQMTEGQESWAAKGLRF
jgi:GDP-mannose 6-dehydrogenase